jgi:7,8-dihydropterin-6-yl-methyl-4-(beta-D-ribofuranosyl)aminobenzene 5'-phosphate synthase
MCQHWGTLVSPLKTAIYAVCFAVAVVAALCCCPSGSASGRIKQSSKKDQGIVLTVVSNNVATNKHLQTSWGMSCLVEGTEKTYLFDTGGDGEILLSNMKKLGKDPEQIDAVFLSHNHADHTEGLWKLLRVLSNKRVEIYVPKSFPPGFSARAAKAGATVIEVDEPREISPAIYTTGERGTSIKEQALVIKTSEGLVVLTGCSHPGIVDMVKTAKRIGHGEVLLVTGGFHLMRSRRSHVERVIDELKRLGVQRVGPSHCTGERAMEMFERAWGADFVDLGCGGVARIGVPAGSDPDSAASDPRPRQPRQR